MQIPEQTIGTAVIVVDGSKVLLGKRKNSYKSGSYGAPGGRVEGTEKIIDCATRELFEETGIKSDKIEYVGVVRDMQEGYSFMHFGFIYRLNGETPKLTEPEKCEGWEWFEINDIPENTLVGHIGVIDMIKNPDTPRYRETDSR